MIRMGGSVCLLIWGLWRFLAQSFFKLWRVVYSIMAEKSIGISLDVETLLFLHLEVFRFGLSSLYSGD